jgi:hypothetical protein
MASSASHGEGGRMSEFHVGEIAIYVRPGSDYFWFEVTITSGLIVGRTLNPFTNVMHASGPHYLIEGIPIHSNGNPWSSKPEWLRKKQQKRDIDQLVSWDDCLWKPKRQTA